MCGIAGLMAFAGGAPPAVEQLRAMCDTIRHRGPDEEGMALDDNVGLGMRRLAIIDLQGGSQPIHNEDGSILTVFNGEIYNFRELRAELVGRGHLFRTGTDTEVIVHAYEEYGLAFADRLNGMFAIALHDRTRQRLILARDHLGIKPLYYAFTAAHLVFGSEIKVLLASGLVPRRLDPEGLADFLAWEYVPGEETLFLDIKKLRPAHMLVIEGGRRQCQSRPFWDVPRGPEATLSAGEWRERVDAQVRQSVRRQLVSDVPLGAFLSGGVDSSLIVAAMGEARTFSIGFADPSYNELGWARQAAAHLGVQHTDEVIRPDIEGLFVRLMEYLEDPIADFSIFPTYLVSRLARGHVTVALSGDGGDELFGGYECYLAQGLAARYDRLPALLRKGLVEPGFRALKPRPQKKGLINKGKRFLEGAAHPASLGHARWRLFAAEAMQQELLTPEVRRQLQRPRSAHIDALFEKAGAREPIARCLYVDLKSYLCDNILTKVDRMSMAVSLEARVPYLDKDLVALAFQVPDALKVARGETKILLKEVAARLLPRQCIYRPKEGFSIPIKNWLRQELRPLLEELLSPSRLAAGGLFEPRCVARLKAEHLGGRANHSHILWGLMIFEAWRRRWLDGGGTTGGAFSGAVPVSRSDSPCN
jgi:asparagine synthase (glutamine-hydrolysing)